MVEIKTGSELDRAVAEAIGLKVHGDTICLIQAHQWDKLLGRSDTDTVMDMPFMPSSHLDATFAAAEAARLFNDGDNVLRQEASDESWEVARLYHSSEVIVASEDTPALAICAAILALAK